MGHKIESLPGYGSSAGSILLANLFKQRRKGEQKQNGESEREEAH
jgi:hypothetical protein